VIDRSRAFLDRLTAWSPVLLLAGLAGLTYWLDAQVQAPVKRNDGSARHDPDLYIDKFRAVVLDPDGRPRQMLMAQRAEHFPDDDTTELVRPSLEITQPDQPTFRVAADRGKVSGDRANAWFTGNVKATRDAPAAAARDKAGGPAGPVTLTTEYLHVLPQDHKVTTDKPVTVEEPRGIIRSVGLALDMDAKTVKLNSAVSGTLQPQAPSK
jgi:lipopolysaccharide export system protein LptC